MSKSTKKNDFPEDDLSCYCGRPTGTSHWICCDGCDRWLHGGCVGVSVADLNKIDKYYCTVCQDNNPKLLITFREYKVGNPNPTIPKRLKEVAAKTRQSIFSDPEPPPQPTTTVTEAPDEQRALDAVKVIRALQRGDLIPEKQCHNCPGCLRTNNCRKCRNCFNNVPPCVQRVCYRRPVEEQVDPILTRQCGRDLATIKALANPRKRKTDKSKVFINKREVYPRLANHTGIVHCKGISCTKQSRPGSDYCSHECGLERARRAILLAIPLRFVQHSQVYTSMKSDLDRCSIVAMEAQDKLVRTLHALYENKKAIVHLMNRFDCHENPSRKIDCPDDKQEYTCYECSNRTLGTANHKRHLLKCLFRLDVKCPLIDKNPEEENPEGMICDVFMKQHNAYCKRLTMFCIQHHPQYDEKVFGVCGAPLSLFGPDDTIDVVDGEIYDIDTILSKGLCMKDRSECGEHCHWGPTLVSIIDNCRLEAYTLLEEATRKTRELELIYNERFSVMDHNKPPGDLEGHYDRRGLIPGVDYVNDLPDYMQTRLDWTPQVEAITELLQKKVNERVEKIAQAKEAEKAQRLLSKKGKSKAKAKPTPKRAAPTGALPKKTPSVFVETDDNTLDA